MGVRIASLDELSYRKQLWDYRPLTDFFGEFGRGYMKKLEENGLYTMGDIARCSVGTPEDFYNEDLLYRHFWSECRTADRSCMGMGAMHNAGDKKV